MIRIQTPSSISSSMKRSSLRALLLVAAFLAIAVSTPGAFAQELSESKPPKQRDRNSDDPTRAELRKRFEARFDEINALKDKGVIGEVWDGSIEALDERLLDKDQRKLLADENADRKALYALIANRVDEGKEQVPPRVVAERNARRNFEKASPDQYLRIKESRWIQKRDEGRAEKIARLKQDGVVGETWEGWLEAVQSNAGDEANSLIEIENCARRAMYDDIAGRIEKANGNEIAREAAKSMKENLPPGEFFKLKDGTWEKRPSKR